MQSIILFNIQKVIIIAHVVGEIKMVTIASLSDEQRMTVARITAKSIALGYCARFSHLETGPVITQYFFSPDLVAPLSKILNRAEDIALSCGVEAVLITRERGLINVSIPNVQRSLIRFDGALAWAASHSTAEIPLVMGQNPAGEYFTLDLSTQPHVLIAGSTGGGKSVFLSQLVLGLSTLRDSSEVKMLLVDTKGVDFPLFKPLDNVIEVVTSIEDLHQHLDKLLILVRTRMSEMQGIARNIKEYRAITGDAYPNYVVVIDEFADIIGLDQELARNETKDVKRTRIKDKLCRIAQISRASGIHLIIATQRPSAKIIDGDIKTNFPTRISFRLPTGIDSRVVLDGNGAESLLGAGDYLFKDSSQSEARRAHGSFVSLEDIGHVIEQQSYIREFFKSQKDQEQKCIN